MGVDDDEGEGITPVLLLDGEGTTTPLLLLLLLLLEDGEGEKGK